MEMDNISNIVFWTFAASIAWFPGSLIALACLDIKILNKYAIQIVAGPPLIMAVIARIYFGIFYK